MALFGRFNLTHVEGWVDSHGSGEFEFDCYWVNDLANREWTGKPGGEIWDSTLR
eukprot:superscaffoldBa00014490_g26361